MVFPATSVIVMIVLLNVDWMWATPVWMFLRTRLRAFLVAATGLLLLCRRFLLAGDRLARALAGTRVRVSTLTADRQAAPVAQTAVAANVHEHLDVLTDFAPQVAL